MMIGRGGGGLLRSRSRRVRVLLGIGLGGVGCVVLSKKKKKTWKGRNAGLSRGILGARLCVRSVKKKKGVNILYVGIGKGETFYITIRYASLTNSSARGSGDAAGFVPSSCCSSGFANDLPFSVTISTKVFVMSVILRQ